MRYRQFYALSHVPIHHIIPVLHRFYGALIVADAPHDKPIYQHGGYLEQPPFPRIVHFFPYEAENK